MANEEPKKMNYQILQENLASGENEPPKTQSRDTGGPKMFENYPSDQPTRSSPRFATQTQGYIVIGLIAIAIILLAWIMFKSMRQPKYAYKAISVQAQFAKSGAADSDLNTTTVGIKDEELSILGSEGWELVGTFLEMETTHPNYGNSSYVMGLQPNVRPQKAVMIFKKEL
jgi:hypothetical protein